MLVRTRTFVAVTTICAVLVGLTDPLMTLFSWWDTIGEYGLAIVDLGSRLSDGAMLAGMSIACSVLVAHLLTRPGWWRWVVALGLITLTIEVLTGFYDLTYLSYFIQHPGLGTVPWTLVAIWLPGILLAVLRPPAPSPQESAAAITAARSPLGSGTVTVVIAAATALLLGLAIFTSMGGIQLLFGVESEINLLLGPLPLVVATVACWQTAGASRANVAWLVVPVLVTSALVIIDLGADALLFPVFALGALGLARSHLRIAARANRLVTA